MDNKNDVKKRLNLRALNHCILSDETTKLLQGLLLQEDRQVAYEKYLQLYDRSLDNLSTIRCSFLYWILLAADTTEDIDFFFEKHFDVKKFVQGYEPIPCQDLIDSKREVFEYLMSSLKGKLQEEHEDYYKVFLVTVYLAHDKSFEELFGFKLILREDDIPLLNLNRVIKPKTIDKLNKIMEDGVKLDESAMLRRI